MHCSRISSHMSLSYEHRVTAEHRCNTVSSLTVMKNDATAFIVIRMWMVLSFSTINNKF
jgi:hypothetical protein